jgi:hypothetical protein
MLSADSSDTNVVLTTVDDGSGRQQWYLVPVPGKSRYYSLKVKAGPPGNSYLSAPYPSDGR